MQIGIACDQRPELAHCEDVYVYRPIPALSCGVTVVQSVRWFVRTARLRARQAQHHVICDVPGANPRELLAPAAAA